MSVHEPVRAPEDDKMSAAAAGPVPPSYSQDESAGCVTLEYSRSEAGLPILLDVRLPPLQLIKNRPNVAMPVFVSFHGGALFIGSRRDPMMDHSVAASLLKAGVIIVFPDYRLLDPSSGWDELQDVKALVSFLNSSAFESSLPHGIQIDYGRFAVGGFSAGGYMTRLLIRELLEAFEKGTSKIQTVACLSYFGMGGDYLLDQWVLKNLTCLTARKPDHLVNGTVLPEIADCPYTPSLPGYAETTAIRDPFCPYYWSTGALHDLTTGEAGFSRKLRSVPHRDREALVATLEAAPLFPQVFLATSALARQWPETLLAHGSGDFVVPHAESLHTFDQLRKLNVAVTLFTVPNGDHDLNDVDTGKAIPQRLEAYQATIDFLLRKLID